MNVNETIAPGRCIYSRTYSRQFPRIARLFRELNAKSVESDVRYFFYNYTVTSEIYI